MGAPLHRADGSATFSSNGYTVLGAVNGPIEVQRRDELPEEAAIEVIVRPASGVGSKHKVRSHRKRIMLINEPKVQKNAISNQSSNRPCAASFSRRTSPGRSSSSLCRY
jgi:ribonuclease PH